MADVNCDQDLHISFHDSGLADVLQRDVPPLGGELHHGSGVHQAVTKLFERSVTIELRLHICSWHLVVVLASTSIGQPSWLSQERAGG